MRTIGKRWPRNAPRGDYTAECSYCGVAYRRSSLVRDGSGRFACPDDARGRDAVTLDRLNAAGGQKRSKLSPPDARPALWSPASGHGLWSSLGSCAYWVEGRDATLDADDRAASVVDRAGGPDFAQAIADRRYHTVGTPRRLDGYGITYDYLIRRGRPDLTGFGAFSLVARVLPDSSNLDALAWSGDDSDADPDNDVSGVGSQMRASDGYNSVFVDQGSTVVTAEISVGNYSNAAWRTIGWSCDGTTATLYINGVSAGSAAFVFSASNTRQEFVGSTGLTRQGIGVQAAFRRALSAADMLAVHTYVSGVYA